jgi:hypothetical protein
MFLRTWTKTRRTGRALASLPPYYLHPYQAIGTLVCWHSSFINQQQGFPPFFKGQPTLSKWCWLTLEKKGEVSIDPWKKGGSVGWPLKKGEQQGFLPFFKGQPTLKKCWLTLEEGGSVGWPLKKGGWPLKKGGWPLKKGLTLEKGFDPWKKLGWPLKKGGKCRLTLEKGVVVVRLLPL